MARRFTRWLLPFCAASLLAAQTAPPPSVSDGLRLKRVGFLRSIAVDPQGNIYVAGTTRDETFFTTPGVHNRSCGSDGQCGATFDRGFFSRGPSQHAFLVKIAPDGGLVFSTFLGADGELNPMFITPTAHGIYVAGEFTEFPFAAPLQFPLKRAVVPACGQVDAFVMKLDPSASALIFSTCIQGPSRQAPISVRGFGVDASGAAVIGGNVDNRNFPLVNALQPVFVGSPGFVTKLASTGELLFSTIFGGSRNDSIWSLAVDGGGDIYLTGITESPDFPTSRAFQGSLSGPTDAFLAKLHRSGSSLPFSTYLGGTFSDVSWDVAIDRNGEPWVVGDSHSVDFPTTADAIRRASPCGSDAGCASRNPSAFLSRFDVDGRLRYSTLIGPDGFEPGQPGGARLHSILIGPRNEKQLIGDFSGNIQTIRPFTTQQCGAFPCGTLMTIGPANDIRFASRFVVGGRLVTFGGGLQTAALGPGGEMYMILPTADFRGSQIVRIGVDAVVGARVRY